MSSYAQLVARKEYPVEGIQALWKYQYDFILIAIEREIVAKEIQGELQEAGIEQKKLIWLAPYNN